MGLAEQETIININMAEREAGYFSFGTSRKSEYERLLRRTGGELLDERRSVGPDGSVTWWQCKVPIKFLSKASWGIRKPGKVGNVRNFAKKA